MFDRDQIVGFQRAAGRHQIDDGIGKTGERCKFHRAVELDEIDVHPLGGKVLAGDVDVLGRHLEARTFAHGVFVVESGGDGHHHPAFGDFEIQRLVEALTAVFDQHVLAGHANVRGAVLHIGRRIGSAHDDHAHIVAIGRDDQLARSFRVLQRLDPGCGQEGQGFFKNTAL